MAGLAFLSLMLGAGVFPSLVDAEKDHLPTQGQLDTCLNLLASKERLEGLSNRFMGQYRADRKCLPLKEALNVQGLEKPLVWGTSSKDACLANSMVKSNEASEALQNYHDECQHYDGYPKLTAHSKVKPPESPVVTQPPVKKCKSGFFKKCK